MRHLYAIGIKLLLVGTVVLSIFGIFSNTSIPSLLLLSLAIATGSYIIGDLFILPQFGNIMATIVDFGLYFLAVLSFVGLSLGIQAGLVLATLATTYFLTLAEPLFHVYMIERVFEIDQEEIIVRLEDFQTEAGEEKIISFKDLQTKELKENRHTHKDSDDQKGKGEKD